MQIQSYTIGESKRRGIQFGHPNLHRVIGTYFWSPPTPALPELLAVLRDSKWVVLPIDRLHKRTRERLLEYWRMADEQAI